MRRYLRLFLVQLRMSVLAALQYRVGFFTDGVLGVLWALVGVLPLMVALDHRSDVVGWNAADLAVLTGCFTIVHGIFAAFLQPALLQSMEHIRAGTLDYLLLRPVDALFSCLTTSFSIWSVLECVAGLVLIAGGLFVAGAVPEPQALLQAAAVMLSGLIALYALGVLALCLSFRALQVENLTYFMEAVLDFGRWPVSVFRGLLRVLFTYVIPLALMTTGPALALLGRPDLGNTIAALATAFVLFLAARLAWAQSLRAYTSASS